MSGVERIGVVVPAHDEQEWLPGCLAALTVAAGRVRIPVDVVVVADGCTDATADVARRAGVAVVETDARNVGIARAIGWDRLRGGDPDTQWLATTDADTLVPPDWLRRMVAYANEGWDAVVGTVAVRDWAAAGRNDAVRIAWQAAYARRLDHVHGANLGVRASSYAAAGGVPARALAEDAGLVAALTGVGARVLTATDLPVHTSARFSTRAPGGFAGYLDDLENGLGA